MGENSASRTPTSSEIPTLLTCKGVAEVWIEVDGKKVPHHSIKYDLTKKEATCWIESEAGKPFCVSYKSTTAKHATQWKVYLDGTQAAQKLSIPEHVNQPVKFQSIRISNTESRSLVFGHLELTDDDTYLNQLPQTESVGEIKVVLVKVTSYWKSPAPVTTYLLPNSDKLHERAKKGLAHRIKQGEVSKPPESRNWDLKVSEILMTMVFRYRPRAMLQANGIIPPDPTPTPTPPAPTSAAGPSQRRSPPVKRELSADPESGDDAPTEEEKALLARLQAIKKEKLAARESGGSAPRKKIKLETNNEPPKFYFTPGEVIDLTGDSPKKKNNRLQRTVGQSKDVLDLT